MQILPPAACTASVTSRCRGTSRSLESLPANGLAQPARFGAMPPLTISPAPPRARREVRRELREVARAILETGVHRAHDDAVGEPREPEIERGEQTRVRHGWDLPCRSASV
jgi:hypothetical protein